MASCPSGTRSNTSPSPGVQGQSKRSAELHGAVTCSIALDVRTVADIGTYSYWRLPLCVFIDAAKCDCQSLPEPFEYPEGYRCSMSFGDLSGDTHRTGQ